MERPPNVPAIGKSLGERRLKLNLRHPQTDKVGDYIQHTTAEIINSLVEEEGGVIGSMMPMPEGTKYVPSQERLRLLRIAQTAYEQAAWCAEKAFEIE